MAITLRKRAPFTCRAAGHHAFPLTDADGTLCPAHAVAARVEAPRAIPREAVPPSGRYMTEAEWAERVARGPIWPVEVA